MLKPWQQASRKFFETIMGKKFTTVRQVFIILVFVFSLIGMRPVNVSAATPTITFTGAELLGRPEADRISISCVPDTAVTIRYQYGTTSGGPYTNSSSVAATAGQPAVITITGLTANTKYYYRMQYSNDSFATNVTRTEHSFWTARAKGSTFVFDVTTDSHINIQLGNASNWDSTLNKIAADAPDFDIDLGDTAAMDNGSTSVALGDTAAAEQKYKDTLTHFNLISAHSPIYLVAGNHEQQENWHYGVVTDKATSLPIMSKNAEKKFYLNPDATDSFYSTDTATYPTLSGSGLKDDYFSWTWGDALFVVINPFWYTTTKPYTTTVGGGETDQTGTLDRWLWTLGQTQFNWLKSTLSGSTAKYKFVFAHQMVGGNALSSPNQVNYGHGGVDSVKFVEWGGYNIDGTTYTWSTNRSGWGADPIADILHDNHVSAFIHGHDHQMGYELHGGVVYQAVPSGSFTGGFGIYTTGGNSGETVWADSTQGPGYLRFTVSPTQTHVEFMRYNNTGTPAYDYTISPNTTVAAKVRDDYDGDGKTDAVKFVSNSTNSKTAWDFGSLASAWNGLWLGTESNMAYVGASDFDGDGKTDMAKFLSSNNSLWYYKSSTATWEGIWLGSGTIANYVAGSDFDGDGKADPAKFFSSPDVLWYYKSSTGIWTGVYLGTETMTYVAGSDFDGDGKTDPAKYIPSTNVLWYLKSSTGTWSGLYMGSDTTAYVAASDFDGDGKTDPAKIISGGVLYYYSSQSSSWLSGTIGTGYTSYIAGCDFNGDGKTDPAKWTSGTHILAWYNGSTWVNIDMGTDVASIGNGQ